MEEKILDMLFDLCGDDIVRENLDVNLHGKLVGRGTQSELLASCSLYQRLWNGYVSVAELA